MRNEFPKEVKDIFYRSRHCLRCGRVDNLIELHHIVGRDSNSAFNCCRLCKDCHDGILHTQECEIELFALTYKYLLNEGYEIQDKDREFLTQFTYLPLSLC